MRNHLEHIEQIERYLNHEMTPAEASAFETSMNNNPVLAEQVATQKLLMQAAIRKAIKADIAKYGSGGAAGFNWAKWLGLTSGIIILAIISYFGFFTNTPEETQKETTEVQVEVEKETETVESYIDTTSVATETVVDELGDSTLICPEDPVWYNDEVESKSPVEESVNTKDTFSSFQETMITPVLQNSDGIFEVAEVMPEYSGGKKEMYKYLSENIIYPPEAYDQNVMGKVYVQFVVDEKGNITQPTVLKSVHPLLDNESIRVISQMPPWTPGMNKGEAVKVRYTLPINFFIDGTSDDL